MREKIADWLFSYEHGNILLWKSLDDSTKGNYRIRTNGLLDLITGEIEKVENPYPENKFLQDAGFNPKRIGFENCRQEILTIFKEVK